MPKATAHLVRGQRPLKLAFFGTSDFAIPTLEILNSDSNSSHSISAVVTQPDKPTGRKAILTPPPTKTWAEKNNITILQPKTLKDDDFFNTFKKLDPDICIVASYGKIIPERYLELPKYGFINIHPSLLPKYRGPSPIQTAIMNGDPAPILSADRHSERGRNWCRVSKETGITIMLMDKDVDHGPILSSKPYYILHTTYYPQAEKDLAKIGAELLIETLPKYILGELKPVEQDHSKATFTKILSREDGRIDWNKSAEEIYNKIRALNPEPRAWTTWQNKALNIIMGEINNTEAKETASTVIRIENSIAVATKKCYLILKQIQPEGGEEMDAVSFVNGHPSFLNSKLD